jgi:hypothetical protein
MSIGAPRGKIFPKKQGIPGAGIFAQLPSQNVLPKALADADHKLKIMEDIDKLNKLFTQCSGMQLIVKSKSMCNEHGNENVL